MLKILKAQDPIRVDTLVTMLVGQPGIGKTSAAFTASKPLLLDFDAGAHRAANRKDSVRITEWTEIADPQAEDFADYDTICVDTAGRCLDAITVHIIKTQPKLARASGALSLQGYGELKAVFTTWIKKLRALGTDVILLAHDAEEKNGDEVTIRPDIQGGSRNEVIKVADMIGFMYQSGNKKILDFSPTDKWIGKNCAGFDPLIVPNFKTAPHFMAEVIANAKEALNRASEEAMQAQAILEEWATKIVNVKDADQANLLLDLLSRTDLGAQTKTVKGMLQKRNTVIGVTYDEKGKQFVAVEPKQEAVAA